MSSSAANQGPEKGAASHNSFPQNGLPSTSTLPSNQQSDTDNRPTTSTPVHTAPTQEEGRPLMADYAQGQTTRTVPIPTANLDKPPVRKLSANSRFKILPKDAQPTGNVVVQQVGMVQGRDVSNENLSASMEHAVPVRNSRFKILPADTPLQVEQKSSAATVQDLSGEPLSKSAISGASSEQTARVSAKSRFTILPRDSMQPQGAATQQQANGDHQKQEFKTDNNLSEGTGSSGGSTSTNSRFKILPGDVQPVGISVQTPLGVAQGQGTNAHKAHGTVKGSALQGGHVPSTSRFKVTPVDPQTKGLHNRLQTGVAKSDNGTETSTNVEANGSGQPVRRSSKSRFTILPADTPIQGAVVQRHVDGAFARETSIETSTSANSVPSSAPRSGNSRFKILPADAPLPGANVSRNLMSAQSDGSEHPPASTTSTTSTLPTSQVSKPSRFKILPNESQPAVTKTDKSQALHTKTQLTNGAVEVVHQVPHKSRFTVSPADSPIGAAAQNSLGSVQGRELRDGDLKPATQSVRVVQSTHIVPPSQQHDKSIASIGNQNQATLEKVQSQMHDSTTESDASRQANILQRPIAPEGTTIVGMVGTTPIVRLENAKQMVAQKRGRFKVLQPVNKTTPAQPDVKPHALRERSKSMSATSEGAPYLPTFAEAPQTFDGTGAPVVKRKGRFFVTNLKDPGLIAVSINPQMVASVPVQTIVPPSATSRNEAGLHSNEAAPTFVQTVAPAVVVAPTTQPVIFETQPSEGYPSDLSRPYQQQVQHPTQAQDQTQQKTLAEGHLQQQQQQHANEKSNDTHQAANAAAQAPSDSIAANDTAQRQQQQAPAPQLESRKGDESKDRGPSSVNKAAVRRAQPAARDMRIGNPPVGLGKMLHFLDQMRTEVSQADKTMKTLQGNMRLLKERNKELEARAMEAERKLRDEKTLREAAETKLKALRKKLRTMQEEDVSARGGVDQKIPSTQKHPTEVEAKKTNSPVPPFRVSSQDSEQEHTESLSAQETKFKANSPAVDVKTTIQDATNGSPRDKITLSEERTKSPGLSRTVLDYGTATNSLPPTPPAVRRKGTSAPTVSAPKPPSNHSRQSSTPIGSSQTSKIHASSTANSATNIAGQQKTRGAEQQAGQPKTQQPTHIPSTQRNARQEHRPASVEFDPLAPKATHHKETVAKATAFDPLASSNNTPMISSNNVAMQGLDNPGQFSHHQTFNMMQPAPMFLMNQNAMALPLYGFHGSGLDAFHNQPMMHVYEKAPTMPHQEMHHQMLQQNGGLQEFQQPLLIVPQHAFSGMMDSDQAAQQRSTADSNMNNPMWLQQTQGTPLGNEAQQAQLAPSQSRHPSLDPFDGL